MSGIKPNRARTFSNDRNYRIAFDNKRQRNFILTQDNDVIGLENPSLIILAQELGFAPKKSSVLNEIIDSTDKNAPKGNSNYSNFIREGGLVSNSIQAVRDIIQDPQGSLDKVKNNALELAQGSIRPAKQVAFVIPRQSFLLLVAINYKGLATKYFNRSEADRRKIIDGWEDKWGGDRGSLEGSFATGKNKLPLFISTKKRLEYLKMQRSQVSFANVTGADDAVAAKSFTEIMKQIASALLVLYWMAKVFKELMPVDPKIDADVNAGQENADNQGGVAGDSLKGLEYEELQAQIDAIRANPNLTIEQKNALISEIESVMPSFFERNKTWFIVGTGGLVLVGFLAYLLAQRQKTN
jgi:hypothetical protein